MSSPNFRFKHFTVWHDHCAMKVGTDGVLLGAWCPLPATNRATPYRVLDIGTGSGLIALMLAQRLMGVGYIDAIDIDQTPWHKHRITLPSRLGGICYTHTTPPYKIGKPKDTS